MLLCVPLIANAQIIGSGNCGAEVGNVTWTLDDEGTLTISGEGDMEDYPIFSAPWPIFITKLVIEPGVTSIGSYSFFLSPGLTSVTIPDGVTSIGEGAFANCDGLTSVTISNSVTCIGEGAFNSCTGLANVTIGSSVKSIGNSAFFCCNSLTSITIPNSVTDIGRQAFYSCRDLTNITISESVTSIDEGAFSYCDSLTDVYYSGSEQDWKLIEIGSYNDCLKNATIHYGRHDQITPVTLTVAQSGGGYVLTAETDYDGIAYAAAYDAEGALISVVSEPFTDGAATVAPDTAGAAKIKFFVWTNTVQPITLAKEITLN